MVNTQNRIKQLRNEHTPKLTQEELAKEIGVTKLTISRWENDETQIKPEKAKILADYFGVSVGYLLGYSKNKNVDFKLNFDGATIPINKEQFLALENVSKDMKKLKLATEAMNENEDFLKNASKYYDYEKTSKRLTNYLFEIHGEIFDLLVMLDRFPEGQLSKEQHESLYKLYSQLSYFVRDVPASFHYFKKNLKPYGYRINSEKED
ncbi:hypothetical protein BOVMAS33_14350 [Streptococcus uberis]